MADAHPPQHPKPSLEAQTINTVSNILAVAGFIILIVIIVWGLLHLATLSSGWFSSTFKTSSTSTLSLSAPESVASGRPVRLTWKYSTDAAGRYSFLYECTDGLEFGIPVLPPGSEQPQLSRVPCGAAFTLGQATSSVIVVPILSTSTPKTAQMHVLFIPTGSGATVQGSAKMSVTPSAETPRPATSTPPTGGSVPAQPGETPPSQPRVISPADLSVTILSLTTDAYGFTVASFDIANTGGSPSGTYYFTATLPTSQPYTFLSQPQSPLGPGDHIVSTLRFTQTIAGLFSVTVSGDGNADNNSASQMVYTSGTYYPTTYQTYPQYQYGY